MRKTTSIILIATLVLVSLLSLSALAATLSRDMPSRVDPGAAFTTRLMVSDAVVGEGLTVEETLPSGVTISSWTVDGVKESKSDLEKDSKKYRVKGSAYGWSVTPTGPVTITYSAKAPSSQGSLNVEAVWFDKSGFNRNQATLSVAPAPAPAPAPAVAPSPQLAPSAPSAPTPSPKPMPKPAPSSSLTWVWMLIVLAILIGVAWWYYRK